MFDFLGAMHIKIFIVFWFKVHTTFTNIVILAIDTNYLVQFCHLCHVALLLKIDYSFEYLLKRLIGIYKKSTHVDFRNHYLEIIFKEDIFDIVHNRGFHHYLVRLCQHSLYFAYKLLINTLLYAQGYDIIINVVVFIYGGKKFDNDWIFGLFLIVTFFLACLNLNNTSKVLF